MLFIVGFSFFTAVINDLFRIFIENLFKSRSEFATVIFLKFRLFNNIVIRFGF